MNETATCSNCEATLVVIDLTEHDHVSCSQCNATFPLSQVSDTPPRTSRQAVASMILGVVSIVGLFVTGIPAIFLGIRALVRMRRNPLLLKGHSMAIVGILSGGGFGLICGSCATLMFFGAQIGADFATKRLECVGHVEEISMALESYRLEHDQLPPPSSTDSNGKPLLSWRVLILPHFSQHPEYKQLYKQFHLDEPWDSPHNKTLLNQIPTVYKCPSEPVATGPFTNYAAVIGKGSAFDLKDTRDEKLKPGSLRPQKTCVLVGEVPSSEKISWSEPRDVDLRQFSPETDWLKGPPMGPFWSQHKYPQSSQTYVSFLEMIRPEKKPSTNQPARENTGNGTPAATDFGPVQQLSSAPEKERLFNVFQLQHYTQDVKFGGHRRFRALLAAHGPQPDVEGHESSTPGTYLKLSEVQVFSQGIEIARSGKVRQSSVDWNCPPERAIDGNTSPKSFSHTDMDADPWWELELPAEQQIDQIEIWSADGGAHPFQVELLDENRKRTGHQHFPVPARPSQLMVTTTAGQGTPVSARFIRISLTRMRQGFGKLKVNPYPVVASFTAYGPPVGKNSLQPGDRILALRGFNQAQFSDASKMNNLEFVKFFNNKPLGEILTLRVQRGDLQEPIEIQLKCVLYLPK